MAETGRRGLGRGLSALLDEAEAPAISTGVSEGPRGSGAQELPIELLRRNPDQPRRQFDQAELDELADSIREKGVLQPILVRPIGNGEHQIVAGERRWRAAQLAGLHNVPVVIRDLDDLEVLEIGIVENVQRADLNPLEEALAYKSLIERFGRTQEVVARVVGKSRSHVANAMRLLALPEEVRDHLAAGRLSAGHARAIATAPDPAGLARQVVERELSVRQAEALSREAQSRPGPSARSPRLGGGGKSADTVALEQDLSDQLGLMVAIEDQGGAGQVTIRYKTLEQLDLICQRLTAGEFLNDV